MSARRAFAFALLSLHVLYALGRGFAALDLGDLVLMSACIYVLARGD